MTRLAASTTILRTDEGLRAWRRNVLIAYTDEAGEAWFIPPVGPRQRIGSADTERELRACLSDAGIRL